ncbi:MAG TPA: hypothetical protein PK177_09235 [Burkholderiaceae bacterium]|nr:hypothetical protein [Burkholderiaceae bacterium]
MKIRNTLGKFAGEVARAIRNFKYELTEGGIYLPAAKVSIGGVFRHAHAPAASSARGPSTRTGSSTRA